MRTLFHLLALSGLFYLIFLVLIHEDPRRMVARWRMRFNPRRVINIFHSDKLQVLLNEAEITGSAANINFYRYVVILAYLIMTNSSDFIRNGSLSYTPLLVSLVVLFITSCWPFAPAGWVLRKIAYQKTLKRDGELISFLRLYESNRMNENHYVKIDAFCLQMSSSFRYLKNQMMQLSERIVDDGLEEALNWWVEQYPYNHPFMSDVRTILLATESIDDQSKVQAYLKDQSENISRISSDQYLRRWSMIGDIGSILTSLPSWATFLMIIVLVLNYFLILKGNLSIF